MCVYNMGILCMETIIFLFKIITEFLLSVGSSIEIKESMMCQISSENLQYFIFASPQFHFYSSTLKI